MVKVDYLENKMHSLGGRLPGLGLVLGQKRYAGKRYWVLGSKPQLISPIILMKFWMEIASVCAFESVLLTIAAATALLRSARKTS